MTQPPEGIGSRPYPFLSPWTVPAVLMTAGGALLLFFASWGSEKGFWLDEALSVARARLDFGSLAREIVESQANMGLYYVLLHVWVNLGTSEAVVRGLSVIFAVLAIPVVFGLGSRLFGARAGVAASVLMAFNAFFVRYSQEARGYSLAVLLVCLSSYWFVRSLQQGSRSTWAAYALTSVLAVYAHLFSVLVVAAQIGSLLCRRRGATPWRGVAGSAVAIGAGIVPLAAFAIFRDAGQIAWIPVPRPIDIYYFFRALAGEGGVVLLGAYALACALAIRHVFTFKGAAVGEDGRWPVAFVAVWLVLPAALAFGVSFMKPVFQNRFLIVSLPALVILAGAGVASIRPRRGFLAAMAVLVALSAGGVRAWALEPERQYWRRTAEYVLSEARPGDAIVFYVYYARVPFEYYVERLGLAKPGVEILELSSERWIAGNRQPEPSPAALDRLAKGHPRVWLVRLQDAAPPGHALGRYEQRQRIQDALSRHFSAAGTASFPGGIHVDRYERRPE